MSEYNIEELARLPVESVIQLRSASNALKSLTESSAFITAHSHHRDTHTHHQLVSYEVSNDEVHYLSYTDDDTFPQKMSVLPVPPSVKQLRLSKVIGSSHGLICIHGFDPSLKKFMAVLLNPSIRKSIAVPVSESYSLFLGFGVCPVTSDPKLMRITRLLDASFEVAVYSLSKGKWTSPSATMPHGDWGPKVATKKFIYSRDQSWPHKRIMSFDLTNETFDLIDLPKPLASRPLGDFELSKIRESLAMIKSTGTMSDVWILEDDGVLRSFTKLFNIIKPSPKDWIIGFTKKGIPIMLITNAGDLDDDYQPPKLVVYEPNSEHNNVNKDKHNNVFAISDLTCACKVRSYLETLLLLGRSDCNTY